MTLDLLIYRGTPTYPPASAKFGTGGTTGTVFNHPSVDNFLSSTGADGGTLTTGTIEAWVKSAAVASVKVFVGRDFWYWIGCNNTGKLQVSWGTQSLVTAIDIDDGLWHHVALVLTAGAPSVYLDGNRVATSATVGVTGGPSPLGFVVGGFQPAGSTQYDWPGSIDEVRLSTVDRYTGLTYPVPIGPFSDSGAGAALYHFDGNPNDSAAPSVYRIVGVDGDFALPLKVRQKLAETFSPAGALYVVYTAGAYPARPATPLPVTWFGPTQPAGMLAGDVWIDNS